MKYIIIIFLLFSFTYGAEHKVLISGFTKHEESQRKNGDKYNEVNYGAGYEYNTFKNYNKWYVATNITALKDSFYEWQYTLSFSPNIRYELAEDLEISIGVASFLMYKKDNFKKGTRKGEAEYDFLVGAAPLSSLYYKNFSLNFAYVPSISFGDLDTVGFLILYFGWEL